MDFWIIFTSFVIPSVGFIAPFGILGIHLFRNKLTLILTKYQWIKFAITSLGLTLLIDLLLLYLSGDLTKIYYGKNGLYTFDGGFGVIALNSISLSFRYNPGISLLSVAFLSGLIYSSLFTLPLVCTYVPSETPNNSNPTGSVVGGSVTATFSAIASTALCCSTSVATVLAPTILILLGPFVEYLVYLSMVLLLYSFYSVVIPRFPTII